LGIGFSAHVDPELPMALIPEKLMGVHELSVILIQENDRVLIKHQHPGHTAKKDESPFQCPDQEPRGDRLIRKENELLSAA